MKENSVMHVIVLIFCLILYWSFAMFNKNLMRINFKPIKDMGNGKAVKTKNPPPPPVWLYMYLIIIHTLHIHYAHAAANLNSGYSKYAKAARVHYFCTIALRTSRAVLTQAWASRRVDLRECRVDSFFLTSNYILLVIFKWLLNLLKCFIYHIIKDKKFVYIVYELD